MRCQIFAIWLSGTLQFGFTHSEWTTKCNFVSLRVKSKNSENKIEFKWSQFGCTCVLVGLFNLLSRMGQVWINGGRVHWENGGVRGAICKVAASNFYLIQTNSVYICVEILEELLNSYKIWKSNYLLLCVFTLQNSLTIYIKWE